MRRRALLLAIADYDPLPSLDYVANDIPRLSAALARAGFDPTNIGSLGAGAVEARPRELTTTRLREAIGDFLDSADPDDEMLVFFSGHGIEINGRRVLIPQDFTPKRPGNAEDMVTDSWVSAYARGCKASSVLVLVDSCPEGARYELAPPKSPASQAFQDDAPLINKYLADATDGPAIAFIHSCAAGEQSGRDVRGEACSAFTRAFAEVIELEKGPAELRAISAETRRRLAYYSEGTQTLTTSGRPGRGRSWETLTIKEDEAARFRARLAHSQWVRQLGETELFQSLKVALPAFASQLRALAMRTEEQVAEARRLVPVQRWRDDGAWYRQAARVYHIFLSSPGYVEVPAEEQAVLLAVPFVYEAALAAVEKRLAAADVLPDPEATSSSGYLVNAWRNAWRVSDAAQIRRGLIARSKQAQADDHACWALVDFCHTSGELWDSVGGAQDRSGWALDTVTAVVLPAPLPEVLEDRRVCEILSPPRLLRLARLMFAEFDDVTLDTSGGNRLLDPLVSSGESAKQLTINEVRLAHLLNIGSRLALDPRRLPPMLAEHIGTDEVLSAEWLRSELANAEWHERVSEGGEGGQEQRWFDLKLDCANDAVDAALLSVVDSLESYRTRLLQRQDIHATCMRHLLPAGFTANRVNAAPSGWHPTRPPLRFELDRTRIIGLLMGQQLYGEKWPALRELYQNALDACRYRRAAEKLAVKEGRARVGTAYQGHIVIRFGMDAGRHFVECVDDGIGMADRHIRRLFAYAGQRFADSHEFHIDRARWEQSDIQFFPNSRFGVGVLSYFMLAEELDIVSRRWVPPAEVPLASVRARIIGTGSLFRLDSAIDPTRLVDDNGTSVRLYLRQDAPGEYALLKSIMGWLSLPEVLVTIQREYEVLLELSPGQPTESLRAVTGDVLLPVAGSENTKGIPRVYIAPYVRNRRDSEDDLTDDSTRHRNDNFSLVDGILTGLVGKPWPVPLIVNLSEDLSNTLTVDRRRVDPTDAAIATVLDWVRKYGGTALAAWTAPGLSELHWTLGELHPDVAVAADTALRAIPRSSIESTLPILDLKWPLSGVGLSDLDPEISCDLYLGNGIDITTMYTAPDLIDDDTKSRLGRFHELAIRRSSNRSVNSLVSRAVCSRLAELADGGLTLPKWLKLAVIFETREKRLTIPTVCRPVMAALEAFGCIGLREFLRWMEADHNPVLDGMQMITKSRPELLGYDADRLNTLGPLHRKLCRLCSANQLTWLEIAFFSQSEHLSLEKVTDLARDLAEHGMLLPDFDAPPDDMMLTGTELQVMTEYFEATKGIARNDPFSIGSLFAYQSVVGAGLYNLVKGLSGRFTPSHDEDWQVPSKFTRKQTSLLSVRFNGSQPFLRQLTHAHLFRAARDRQFGTFADAVSVTRSLFGCGVDIDHIATVDDDVVARFDKVVIADNVAVIIERSFHAIDLSRPVSVWDLALAATAANVDPETLLPVLDLLEQFHGDVARCHEFLAFCASVDAST